MKTKLKYLLIMIPIFLSNSIAQPFIYFSMPLLDNDTTESFYNYFETKKLNLKNNVLTDFDYTGRGQGYNYDQEQKYLVIDEYYEGKGISIYSIEDANFIANFSSNYNVSRVLYSGVKNKLYIFLETPDENQLLIFDLLTNQLSDLSFPTPYGITFYPFFSLDHNNIYLTSRDTITENGQILSFSINLNQIISKNYFEQLGITNYEITDLKKGFNGKGIIFSRTQSLDTFYYKIYDLDNSEGSNFISNPYPNSEESYFTNGEKYLILCDLACEPDTIGYATCLNYYTGKLEIYNTFSSQLVKTLQLPERGKFYYFDNYPNNIYYVVNP